MDPNNRSDGARRQPIVDSFMEFNRSWASAAPVVALVLARTELQLSSVDNGTAHSAFVSGAR